MAERLVIPLLYCGLPTQGAMKFPEHLQHTLQSNGLTRLACANSKQKQSLLGTAKAQSLVEVNPSQVSTL